MHTTMGFSWRRWEFFSKKKKGEEEAHGRDRYKFCLNSKALWIVFIELCRGQWTPAWDSCPHGHERASFSIPLRRSVWTRGSRNPKWFLFQGVKEENQDRSSECYWEHFMGNSQLSSPHAFSCSREQCLLMLSISGNSAWSLTWIHVSIRSS